MAQRIPCPYQPFGRPCILTRAHRRPHKIQVEAAYVDRHTLQAEIRGLSRTEGSAEALMRAMRDAPRDANLVKQAAVVADYLEGFGFRVVLVPVRDHG